MCVEAAVCFALGQEHGDEPECVAPAVRSFKIRLNDSKWSSNEARAKGMRRIAIAQLGTAGQIDEKEFARVLAELTIQRIVPIALRAAAEMQKDGARKAALEDAANKCETDGTEQSAREARKVAAGAANAAADAADADDAAFAAADAARAADAGADAADAALAAALAAADAADAALAAADADDAAFAAADAAGRAAVRAANAAASAAGRAAKRSKHDEILSIAADIGVEALRIVGAAGVKLMDKLITP
jgi:hypothetical protein